MSDDYELKVRKGQAFNLAVSQAIHNGRADSNKYIAYWFARFFDLASKFQKYNVEDVTKVLESSNDGSSKNGF